MMLSRPATRGEYLLAAFMIGGALGASSIVACTPAQKADARTALNVSSCINAVVLRHLEDDLKDPSALAVLASEIAIECNPQQAVKP